VAQFFSTHRVHDIIYLSDWRRLVADADRPAMSPLHSRTDPFLVCLCFYQRHTAVAPCLRLQCVVTTRWRHQLSHVTQLQLQALWRHVREAPWVEQWRVYVNNRAASCSRGTDAAVVGATQLWRCRLPTSC